VALVNRSEGDVRSYITSSNVSAITWGVTNGMISYTSGGIAAGTFVMLDTSSALYSDVCQATSGTLAIGVALDEPAVGPGVGIQVQISGRARCKAASAISVGDRVMVGDSTGRVATASAAGATSLFLVGQALTAATIINDFVEVQLQIGISQNISS